MSHKNPIEIPIVSLRDLRPQTRDFLLGRCIAEHRTPSDVLRDILDNAAHVAGTESAAAAGEPVASSAAPWPTPSRRTSTPRAASGSAGS